MDLLRRVTGTQKTIDKFLDRPFEWGRADCAILAATHLRNLGIKTQIGTVRGYKSIEGAKRALVKLGVTGMEDLADAMFERIPVASALAGDIVGIPGGEVGDEWLGMGVAIGQGRALAFAEGVCAVGDITVCTHAWRVG